jgi:hypothetical protein
MRSLVKTGGGDDRNVVRHTLRIVEAERPHAVDLGRSRRLVTRPAGGAGSRKSLWCSTRQDSDALFPAEVQSFLNFLIAGWSPDESACPIIPDDNVPLARVLWLSDTEREMPAEYVPTADQRALVENAAAFGITEADIAEQLKIDEKTLREVQEADRS